MTLTMVIPSSEPLCVCNVCGLEAYAEDDLEKFVKEKRSKHGRQNKCKKCINKHQQEMRHNFEWYHKNPRFPVGLLFGPLRKCNRCGFEAWNEEDIEKFNKSKSSHYGRRKHCKKCSRKEGVEYHHKNRERHREYRLKNRERYREYRLKNREKILERTRKHRKENPILAKIYNIRSRSKEKNLPFNLDVEHLKQLIEECDLICPMTGIKMKVGGSGDPHTLSIDRIIPEKGYVKGNVRLVSFWFNMARSNWGDDFTVDMCRRVAETHQK